MTVEEFKIELEKLMIELNNSQKSLVKEIRLDNHILYVGPRENVIGGTNIEITFI